MKKLVFFIYLVFTGYFTYAQVVNIEKKRGSDSIKFQGEVFLAIDFDKNASELFELKNDIQLQYQHKKSTYLFLNHLKYVRAGGKPFLNEGFQHIRYKYDFNTSFLEGELLTQYQFNTINKLEHRFLFGGGPRFKLFDSTNCSIYMGPLFMYEYEKLSNETLATDAVRISSYVAFFYKFPKAISLKHPTYYQPLLTNFSDYRISSETSLNFSLSKKFAFKLIFEFLYDTNPPKTVPNIIYSISNGLNYSF